MKKAKILATIIGNCGKNIVWIAWCISKLQAQASLRLGSMGFKDIVRNIKTVENK